MGPDNALGYAWWRVEPYKQLYCKSSYFDKPVECNTYIGFKPLTLEHVGPQPITFDSQRKLKQYLRDNNMYSRTLSD